MYTYFVPTSIRVSNRTNGTNVYWTSFPNGRVHSTTCRRSDRNGSCVVALTPFATKRVVVVVTIVGLTVRKNGTSTDHTTEQHVNENDSRRSVSVRFRYQRPDNVSDKTFDWLKWPRTMAYGGGWRARGQGGKVPNELPFLHRGTVDTFWKRWTALFNRARATDDSVTSGPEIRTFE